MKRILLLLSITIISLGSATAAPHLTYPELVQRLTDLEYLARLPEPGDTCQQYSSYDRKSRYDIASGKYLDWDANGDGDGILRKEGDGLVLAEMEGPGCIWRIWSAEPKQGRVRIYLDGANEPAVDLPFIAYFDRKNPPFTRAGLVHTVARGWNNYTPIPYQKSCKIVAEPGWGLYYHFTYETFPKGTSVPAFKPALNAEDSKALDEANETLLHGGSYPAQAKSIEAMVRTLHLLPGKSVTLPTLKGPRAITRVRARLSVPPAPADRDVLRELTVQFQWDGEKNPAVWSPLGDFFGTAGANTYRSLPLGHGGDEWWYCNWYMPFAEKAELTLANDGKAERTVLIEVSHAPLSQPVARYARFHAKWHRDAFLPPEPERGIDWTMLKTEGAGRFVGVMLHIWNPRGSWWGEGDEKFFVDGEKFPSTFGTGSEDYFGYAWCNPTLFENAYHNQTHNDGNNKGHVTVNRWHIGDSVPFQNSFEGAIEKYFSNQRPTLYAATAYWYLAPGGNDPYGPVPVQERVGYWQPLQTLTVKGALEGERLRIISKTGGNPQEQGLTEFPGQWSNDAHLWWIAARPGDKLELAVPVTKDGSYKLGMQLTKAPDYGVVQLSLDGKTLGKPVDLFHSSVIPTGLLDFGAHRLSAGDHTLAVEIVGANEKAIKSYMFGLDYVTLTPVP